MSAEQHARGRGLDRSRSRAAARLVVAAATATTAVGVAVYGAVADPRNGPEPSRELVPGWAGGRQGAQILGGDLEAGRPTVQRMVHDGVQFTVSVAPGRPGPNLVRVDSLVPGPAHTAHIRRRDPLIRVGTSEATMVRARPRPGVDGLWANVDLPRRSGMVLVSHGPEHRVPFVVSTGDTRHEPPAESSVWNGPDGPECLGRAAGALLSGGSAPATGCPSERLAPHDREALAGVVRTLAGRGVEEVAVSSDSSPRSRQALAAARREAAARGVRLVGPRTKPGARNALLVVSGWSSAARELSQVTARPLRHQPIRSDGTWLAPWLLSPQVVDSTAGAVIPLWFDIREEGALAYSRALRKYLPGQAPTASGFEGWRGKRGAEVGQLRLYAASRTAYMPADRNHTGHETTVSWFPGGTITPVGTLRAH